MSYTKTTWVTGDTITATKMNNIESGVEAASEHTIVEVTDNSGVLDKTVDEIAQLLSSGTLLIICHDTGYPNDDSSIGIDVIMSVGCSSDSFGVGTLYGLTYYADTINDYPEASSVDPNNSNMQ